MKELFSFLSGHIPGGLFLLSFVLLSLNIALYYFYKSSKLFPKETYYHKLWKYNFFIIALYVFLWFFLRPAGIPEKVLVLPFQNGDKAEYTICESVQSQLEQNLSPKYVLHSWEWFYDTAEQDSIDFKLYRIKLARKLGISIIISGEIHEIKDNYNFDLEINAAGEEYKKTVTANDLPHALEEVLNAIQEYHQILQSTRIYYQRDPSFNLETYITAKLAYLNDDYKKTLKQLDDSNFRYQLLISQALLKRGIKQRPKESRSHLEEEVLNPYFQRIKHLLIPYSKKGQDIAELNLILGRMYLYERDYGMAEVCLKKALAQDRYNSRVHYNLSFLHIDRLNELHYKDRIAVLNYCVRLDPGFADAVYELANEYYITGTGVPTSSHTENAMALLRDYLKLNSNKPEILSLLGKIYLQSKYTLEAISVYERLLKLNPQVAENNYNLGIGYFHLKDYARAEDLFKKAIKIGDHSDSYLYLGAIYKLREDWDQALYYFRERIKRQTGDDDRYAKEAMRGVRLILEKQQGN